MIVQIAIIGMRMQKSVYMTVRVTKHAAAAVAAATPVVRAFAVVKEKHAATVNVVIPITVAMATAVPESAAMTRTVLKA